MDRPLNPVFAAAKRAAAKRDAACSQLTPNVEEGESDVDVDGAKKQRKRLLSAGSNAQKTPASNPRSTTQGSSFVVCPICFGSFARSLVDAHVSQCMEAVSGGKTKGGGGLLSQPLQSQTQQKQKQHQETSATPSTSTEPLRTLSQVLKPQRGGSGGCGCGGSSKARPLPPPPLSQPAPPQPPAAAAALASGASAFTELMRAQRSASLVHVFYLEMRGESFFWHWGTTTATAAGASSSTPSTPSLPRGLPPAAWTSELSVPLPDASPSSSSSQKITVRLATNLPPGPQQQPFKSYEPAESQPPPPPTVFPRLAPSLLKSALQKNIRLGRADAAVRVAAHMIRQGETGELLRRLPIVAVEDACLSPALPLAVFAMAAFSKNWSPLPAAAERAILKFVRSLACTRVRDDPELWGEEERDGEEEKTTKETLASLFLSSSSSSTSSPALDPQAALLVRVLHLRAAFGGMPCDVSMMREASRVWLGRFLGRRGLPPPPTTLLPSTLPPQNANAPPPRAGEAWLSFLWRSFTPPPPPLPPPSTPLPPSSQLTREDVPLSAVDFHCSSIAEELMRDRSAAVAREARKAAVAVGERETDEEAAEERLRRAMWLFRSSRNVRSFVSGSCASSSGVVVLGADTERAALLRERLSVERDQLRPLWRAAASACDAWAQEYLSRRFSVGGAGAGRGVPRRF